MGRSRDLKKRAKKRRKRSSSSSSSSTGSSRSSSVSTSASESAREKLKRVEKRLKIMETRAVLTMAPGVESVIPVFDPQTTTQSIESWVARVDRIAASYAWSGATVVRLVAQRLKGMARRWYDAQDQLTADWTQMYSLRLSLKQFHKPVPFSKLLREAALYRAEPGQDLSEYCFNKLALLRNLNPATPEEHLVDGVIGGIDDENIARAAM